MEKLATVTTTFPISALSLLSIPEALDPEIPTINAAHSAIYPMVPMISGKGTLIVGRSLAALQQHGRNEESGAVQLARFVKRGTCKCS
jgi:hypothetical protein